MIERNLYLKKLISFKDKKLIKVITGIRRCGKSTLLKIFQDYLLLNNVEDAQIISINFENPDFEDLKDYKNLYNHIEKKLVKNKKNYVFLDEIQSVREYQKAVDGLYIKENIDLYITGSNAYFLSGELATLLSGRYVEIEMLPLSFSEYLSALPEKTDLPEKYRNYLVKSSFPCTLELQDETQIRTYLDGIYNTVILKDVVARKNISDVHILESVVRYMFDNIANITSVKKISDALTSAGRKISNHTVENYLSALTDSFILYKSGRYDVKGKQYLQTNEKYYLVDIGLRYFLLGSKKADMGRILENVVYLELLRRGYEVYVGKVGTLEVDFVAVKNGDVEYYQVAQSVQQLETLERELKPLDSIKDHNPKYLLTLDVEPPISHKGIKQIYVLDWLI
ncbi:MAG: ATP-binding protein [Candidatus Gastranaerophilales bacterium]|nr:ATP-binding protein [Candidatus Gastranaerophilales bacterium]